MNSMTDATRSEHGSHAKASASASGRLRIPKHNKENESEDDDDDSDDAHGKTIRAALRAHLNVEQKI